MKDRFIRTQLVLLLITGTAGAQESDFLEYDYAALGLSLSVPSTWTYNGMLATTKTEFIKEFGRTYTGADGSDLWRAFGSFISLEVDSTLVPSDSAYSLHELRIFVERSPTWIKQWLCRFGKRTIWREEPQTREMVVVQERTLENAPIQPDIFGVYGKVYELKSARTNLSTLRHVYAFVHQKRCYNIEIESTSAKKMEAAYLHERILGTLKVDAD